MRFIAAFVLSMLPISAFADAIDCEKLKTTSQPFEISWSFEKSTVVLQVYREKSGDIVYWRQRTEPERTSVSKIAVFDGVGSEFTLTNPGNSIKGKSTFSGLPKGYDHRSDITYTIYASDVLSDGQKVKTTTVMHVHFVSETRKTIGPCVLAMVKSERSSTVNGKTTGPGTFYSLPDLRTPGLLPAGDDTEFHISTSFTPLKLLE